MRRRVVRAVVMREFGPPEVLEPAEVDEVRAGPGEVVIEAEFANVTFVETQIRAGRAPHSSMLPALPVILGNGTGGTVAGRRVVASLNGTGGYAERVVADAGRLIEVPDEVTLRDAVALLADGRTALSLVGRAGLVAGETVLVEAAGGGVGTLLVQLARQAGTRGGAVAGGPGQRGPGEAGRIPLLGGWPASAEESAALSRAALGEAAAGRLRPVIGQEFELASAAAAHAAIEARVTTGKTLLTVPR